MPISPTPNEWRWNRQIPSSEILEKLGPKLTFELGSELIIFPIKVKQPPNPMLFMYMFRGNYKLANLSTKIFIMQAVKTTKWVKNIYSSITI